MGPYYDTAHFPHRHGRLGSMLITDLQADERFLPRGERRDRITLPVCIAVLVITIAGVVMTADPMGPIPAEPVVAAYTEQP